ncbi:hypothetical protein [Ornithinimicrobium cavernae]|uniref:YkvI family membrane protein n=1 Tax=Ornithinimicrobium cavernae TaxID=2666047 RepID=UPI000D690E4E|nr:hypothetical protein [Ornithinimicrobium cavernae]
MAEQAAPREGFFNGPYGRLLLPGVILQSVLIGGGYATGREIVEFGAKYGALGWIAGVAIIIGFGLMAFLMFEIARRFQAFDYRTLLQKLIGPLYWLFDIVYILLAILIIAIMAAATGEILQETLGFNYWLGVGIMIVIVGLLNFYGEGLIERFKSVGTAALYAGYILFAVLIISENWDAITATLSSGDHSLHPNVSVWAVLWSGILYVGYNLAVYPAALFTVRRQTRLRHTVVAGIVAGLLMTVPWFLTYFALMGFYPDAGIFDASVPWLEMLSTEALWVIVVFGIVVGWTLIETATGMIYALVARVDQSLVDADRRPMSRATAGAISVVTLLLALLLAQVGIIDLIATGYTAMAYAMIAVFGIPLLVRGTYLIVTRQGLSISEPSEPLVHDRSRAGQEAS